MGHVNLIKDTIPGGRSGSTAIGTTAVQVADSGECFSGIEIRADSGNTDVIYVGYNSSVTAGTAGQSDGFPLQAGDSKSWPVESPNKLWLISGDVSQKVFWDAK